MTKIDLARLWREVNGSPRWPSDVDAFVDALLAAAPAAPAEPVAQHGGLTREAAVSIAKQAAWDAEPRPDYVPLIPSAAEWAAWMPHEWVIDAVLRAAAPVAPALVPLTDEQILAAIRTIGIPRPMGLTRDRGPYEVTEPTYYLQLLVRAVEAAHGIKP